MPKLGHDLDANDWAELHGQLTNWIGSQWLVKRQHYMTWWPNATEFVRLQTTSNLPKDKFYEKQPVASFQYSINRWDQIQTVDRTQLDRSSRIRAPVQQIGSSVTPSLMSSEYMTSAVN